MRVFINCLVEVEVRIGEIPTAYIERAKKAWEGEVSDQTIAEWFARERLVQILDADPLKNEWQVDIDDVSVREPE